MLGAIWLVHWGRWNFVPSEDHPMGGMEFQVVLLLIMLFFIALGLSSIGPGNIATTAIMAPMAMAVAYRAAVPPFLMALMVGNGAQAGALSRFAPTGIIVNTNMEKIGLGGFETQTYLNNLMAHAVVTFAAYLLFGGLIAAVPALG
mgnify:CR=1 FL=1